MRTLRTERGTPMVKIYEIKKYQTDKLARSTLAADHCGELLFFTGVRYERLEAKKANSRHLKKLVPFKAHLQGHNTNFMMQ